METQIVTFEGNDVRIQDKNGVVWFLANDVAKITGHTQIRRSISTILDEDEVTSIPYQDKKGVIQNQLFINESGLYKLTFKSKLPKAKVFTKMVTNVILPQIRKTGTFGNNQLSENVNQLGTHKRNLKILDVQISELNKKRRHEKSNIEILENLLFTPTLSKQTRLNGSQNDLFSLES